MQEYVFALPLLNPQGPRTCSTSALLLSLSGLISASNIPFAVSRTDRALEDSMVDGDACPFQVCFYVNTVSGIPSSVAPQKNLKLKQL